MLKSAELQAIKKTDGDTNISDRQPGEERKGQVETPEQT
jgi:hypothetical protein